MLKQTLIVTALLSVSGDHQLQAHNLPISEMMLVADEEYLHLEIVLNATELTFFRELDQDRNGHVSLAEAAERGEQCSRRVLEALEIRIAGQLVDAEVSGLVPNHNTHHLTIRAHYPGNATAETLELTSRLAAITHGAHLVQVVFRTPHDTRKARLNASANSVSFRPQPVRLTETGNQSVATPDKPPQLLSWWTWFGVPLGASLLLGCFVMYFRDHR